MSVILFYNLKYRDYHHPLTRAVSVSQVYYWRERSLHRHNGHHMEKHILNFSGDHTRGVLPGLHPFSLYLFNVRVYNGRGEGPPSITQQFETPEGGRRLWTPKLQDKIQQP